MQTAVGIDIGYGNCKVVSNSGWYSFPSIVGNFEDCIAIPEFGNRPLESVEIEGEKFLIGESARKHSTRFFSSRDRGWINSRPYRALIKFVLNKSCSKSESVAITSGLPASYYKADKDNLSKVIRKIAEDMEISSQVSVIPQPMGAFLSEFFDEKGHVFDHNLASGRIGVLDVGYFTTDLVTLDCLDIVDRQVASIECGVSTAMEAIKRDLYDKWQINLDLHRVEESVRRGKIVVFGEERDLSDIRDQRLNELANEIEAQAKTIWGNAADLNKIILAGGGAALLYKFLNFYRHAQIVRDPAFSIASGFYRHAVRKCI